jgi:hypothetical protein
MRAIRHVRGFQAISMAGGQIVVEVKVETSVQCMKT